MQSHLTDNQLIQLMEITSDTISTENLRDSIIMKQLRSRLLQVRDFLRDLCPSSGALFHAAADIIHLYAYTETWFSYRSVEPFNSPGFEISELGLNLPGDSEPPPLPSYSSTSLWATCMYWMNPSQDSLDEKLLHDMRFLAILPSLRVCFSNNPKHSLKLSYTLKQRNVLLDVLKLKLNRAAKDTFFQFDFDTKFGIFGSPYLDRIYGCRNLEPCLQDLRSWTPLFEPQTLLSPVRPVVSLDPVDSSLISESSAMSQDIDETNDDESGCSLDLNAQKETDAV